MDGWISMELDEFDEYLDMIEATEVIPQFGFRVLVGLDKDSEIVLCINRVGTIETMTFLGVLETLKARILEA